MGDSAGAKKEKVTGAVNFIRKLRNLPPVEEA
jgi:hypothetical protein